MSSGHPTHMDKLYRSYITNETRQSARVKFPCQGHFPRKTGNYQAQTTHYLFVGPVICESIYEATH